MKRTAFDDRRDVQIANEYGSGPNLACTFCQAPTRVSYLNTYGARCFSCYARYCSMDRHFDGLTKAMRLDMATRVKAALAGGLRATPRHHIAQLDAKEAAGAATPAQRGFLGAVRNSAKAQASD